MPTIVFTIGTSKRRIHHHALPAEVTNVHTWIRGIHAVQGAGTLSFFAIRKRHKLKNTKNAIIYHFLTTLNQWASLAEPRIISVLPEWLKSSG
jgi:hypothetical protein